MLVARLCPTPCDPRDCSPPASSVHGILQGRILKWVAMTFLPQGIFWPRDRTRVSWIAGRFLTFWDTREAQQPCYSELKASIKLFWNESHPKEPTWLLSVSVWRISPGASFRFPQSLLTIVQSEREVWQDFPGAPGLDSALPTQGAGIRSHTLRPKKEEREVSGIEGRGKLVSLEGPHSLETLL